jgi:hypothetical protein
MLRRYIARVFGYGPPFPATLRFLAENEAYKADLAADPPIPVPGRFDDWPVSREEELGSCPVKAWKGEYRSAEEVLLDVRAVLEKCGKIPSEEEDNAIDGIGWAAEFEYDQSKNRISRSLRTKE